MRRYGGIASTICMDIYNILRENDGYNLDPHNDMND